MASTKAARVGEEYVPPRPSIRTGIAECSTEYGSKSTLELDPMYPLFHSLPSASPVRQLRQKSDSMKDPSG